MGAAAWVDSPVFHLCEYRGNRHARVNQPLAITMKLKGHEIGSNAILYPANN